MTITEVLNVFDDGEAVERLDEDIRDLASRVEATGKSGKITITVKLEKVGRLVEGSLKWKSEAPRPDVGTAMFFVSEEGALQQEDPKQTKLKLEVRRPTA
jgi:hypothetical protein